MKQPRKLFTCTQTLLYTLCAALWKSCSDYLSQFAALKAYYTTDYITAALKAVTDAQALPNSTAAIANRKYARTDLVNATTPVKNNWQLLKQYILAAYPIDMALNKLIAAGAPLYAKANIGRWSTVASLIATANDFIADNLDDLTANNNMPVGFQKIFEVAGEAWSDTSVIYFDADNAKKMAVNQKIEANNAICESVMAMVKDGQQIFKDNEAVKSLFVFSQQSEVRTGAGIAKLTGTITNEAKMPVIGATIVSKELNYKAITNEKGRFSINRILAGDYTFTISCPGYVSVDKTITLTAGKSGKFSLSLAMVMKKVA
jgi:hypothetical protein